MYYVSIIGKTNVGKSSFFNFLIKKKRSIVSKKPNTTLNINNGILKIKDIYINLIDTSGFLGFNVKNNKILSKKNIQLFSTIKKTDLILYMVDISEGINYLDNELIFEIKKQKKFFFL
ncbi:MAG: 50S ribosome-binding GTPase [Candidatus Shikimatogenerans sp. JK-2022]|nr:50S ribosome-binding GTPase [Candidatus Shikimatogenerans bostrichidophilus]